MYSTQPVTIQPRVIVVDVSAKCSDAALLDAAGGAIYGAYHYDAAAPFTGADGRLAYQVYPLAVTPLRQTPGFSAERALGGMNPKTGLPLAAAYLEQIAERFGAPQVFPDVTVSDPAGYRQAYADVMNDCVLSGFNRLPAWVVQARQHRTLRVRQRALTAGRTAPESFLVDYIAADGSRGCFGIDMRNHVDRSLPRPACASGWSTSAEILQAVEKQFSRCADINRGDYHAFEVPVHGRLLREAFFWSAEASHDEVLQVHSAAPGSGRFTVSYLGPQGQPCEVELRVALHGAARLSGALDWLDIVVAIEQECAAYPAFDLARYSVIEVSDGVRTQREMFLPQARAEVRQAA
jgi:hypothetical protein